MISMKLVDKNNNKKEKMMMSFTNDTMSSLVQLYPDQQLKGNIIERIREMNKNAELNKNKNCSNC